MINISTLLRKKLLPGLKSLFPAGDGVFQHDGAPSHTAKSVKAFLSENKVAVLPWPSNSPDMNPIENLWMIVKQRIAEKRPTS